ncbi:Hypothetical protein SRAE_X000130000 [Strongyloides ratti]|uniref:Uncharacterized protein n=1 Tax=Strongyloides ratti TaxID=34506 RepID=A0A090KPQ6_STRRB|nr:Hypothetical protein SRAE_X000130000 [Strongyloides ratti]CEF59553.1 Hypothetical protein SRAE_X000130000 [Strongyloides ratti]
MDVKRNSVSGPSRRRASLVEVAEKHFDTNTLILIVNVLILVVAMSLLYMIATSAATVGKNFFDKDEN